MGLFKKNPNETNYPGGKKTWLSVIKNEGDPGNVLWKVPYEDFNENSVVIVGENEEALFWKNGEILQTFTAGEYKLSTQNYPVFSRIRNSLSGGVSVFNCKVIYVNKAHKLDNRWGTSSPIKVVDKVYDIPTQVLARGAFTMQIENAKKFFLKYNSSYLDSVKPAEVTAAFRAPINQAICVILGNAIKSRDEEILGICTMQEELSEAVKPKVAEQLEEYGIRLVNFFIEAIEIADDASRRALNEARANKAATVIGAQAEKQRLETLGITWSQSESAKILDDLAKNEGNPFVAAGAGLGAGAGMGASMGQMAGNVMTPLDQPGNAGGIKCGKCGKTIPAGTKFCPECGAPMSKFCPQCGKPIAAGSKFCPECGAKLE